MVHSLTVSVSGTMAERPGQVGQLPTAGREAPPRPCGGRRRSRAGLLPCLGPGGGWVAGVWHAGWTRPPGPRMGRSAVGAATARHRPAADKSWAGLGRYHSGKRSVAPRGSAAGLAGQISSGQIGVGGPGGQFGADRAAGAARGGQFRWSACWSVRSRR